MTPEALNEKTPFAVSGRHHHQYLSDSSSYSSAGKNDDDREEARRPAGRRRMCPYTDVDRGWAWVALAATFCANTIMGAQYCSVNIFYPQFLEVFGQSRADTSWYGSLNAIVLYSSGSLGSFLLPKIGIRRLFFLSAFAISISFVTVSLSNSLLLNIAVYGLLGGLGYGFVLTGVVAVNGRYFSKYTFQATSASFVGGGLGTMIYGPLLETLIHHYGWRGAALIYAGVSLNLCVVGCAVFPERKKPDAESLPSGSAANGGIQQLDDVGDIEKAVCGGIDRLKSAPSIGRVIITRAETVPQLVSSPHDIEQLDSPRLCRRHASGGGGCRSLLSDPNFWLLSAIAFCWGFGSITFLAIFKDLITSSGLPQQFGTAVLLFGGGNTFTRVVIAFLSFKGAILRLAVALLLGCVVFSLFSVADVPWAFLTLSAVAGSFLGFTFVMLPVVVGIVYGREQMAVNFGYVFFSVGLSNAVGPPLVGFLRDATGSYVSGLCCISLSTLIGAVFALLLYFRQLREAALDAVSPPCRACRS